MKQLLLVGLLLLLKQVTLAGPNQELNSKILKIDSLLKAAEKQGFAGGIVIQQKGEVLFSKGYGFAHKKSSKQNTPHTFFDIGSIAKTFTATAILKLVEENKLSLDTPLGQFLETPNDMAQIKISQLLNHTSGLISIEELELKPSDVPNELWKNPKKLQEFYLSKTYLHAPPGEKFKYCNSGFNLLAFIIETVTKESFEKYIENNLWKPIGIKIAHFNGNQIAHPDAAYGYFNGEELPPAGAMEYGPFWKGISGMIMTPLQVSAWLQSFARNSIISQKTKELMWSNPISFGNDPNAGYAFGWEIETYGNRQLVSHTGSTIGFVTVAKLDLSNQTSLVAFSNTYHKASVIFDVNQIFTK